MKILVCISNVPDTTTKITFINNNTEINQAGVQFVLNPYDEIALSRALELIETEGTVTVIHVGDESADPTIRKALAIGATDAVRINAKATDAYFVAQQIAEYAKDKNFDIILTGRESIDYNGGKVAAMLGEILAIPSISIIKKLITEGNTAIVEREIEGGKEVLSIPFPFVAGTAEGVAEWKIPNMRGIMSARTKPLLVVAPIEVKELQRIVKFEAPTTRSTVKLTDANEAEKLIDILHSEAKVF
jgi:electron transfer flavoprotein beta subunit